jgi:hypothetical protein
VNHEAARRQHPDALTPGDQMKGPALFESVATTVLVLAQ